MKNKEFAVLVLTILSVFNSQLATAYAQGTAFTYQGRLSNGVNPANGSYDVAFTLYGVSVGGSGVAGPVTNGAVAVSNGLFTTTVDLGNAFNGADRWLELAVRTNGNGVFTMLVPRQPLTPTPYAIYAGSANAAGLTGSLTLAQLPGSVVTNGSTNVNFTGAFTGDGTGLTGVANSQTNLSDWKIWNDATLYYAQSKTAGTSLSSNDFSGLLYDVLSRSPSIYYDTRLDFASTHKTFTPGTVTIYPYWFSNTVFATNGVILEGAGNSATIFAAAPSLTGPMLQIGSDTVTISGIVRAQKIRFEGASGGAGSVGLRFRGVAEPNVEGCEFNQFKLAGLQFSSTNYNHWSHVKDNFFVGGGAGSHCLLIDGTPVSESELGINLCTFQIFDGMGLTVSNYFRNLGVSDCVFKGGSPWTAAYAISVHSGSGFKFSGNTFKEFLAPNIPIRFEDQASPTNLNAVVSDNIIQNQANAPTNLVYIGANVQGISLIGNVNPHGTSIAWNPSGSNTNYAQVDAEKIYTSGTFYGNGGGLTNVPGSQTNTVGITTNILTSSSGGHMLYITNGIIMNVQ